MRKGDLAWLLALASVAGLLIVPVTHRAFVGLTASHPYLIGFAKFFVLATMGELAARRIASGAWSAPPALLARACVWGDWASRSCSCSRSLPPASLPP